MEVTLVSLIEKYKDDDRCRDYLTRLRWPNGVVCIRCGDVERISHLASGLFECNSCGYKFSATASTIFHDSHLPLTKWFLAVYIMVESKKGVSANQMKRMLGVSYKTAWYLCHRIRKAMQDESAELLAGIVEVDETWVGGKAKNMHLADKERRGLGKHGVNDMTMVLGAIQRGGDVKLKVSKRRSADKATMQAFLGAVVADETDWIMTDEAPVYRGIEHDRGIPHEAVDHKAGEYVVGMAHTNTVEGVWSLFKRSIVGSYHQLSAKHLQAYLDEMAFRFNNRENPYMFRETMLRLIEAEAMPYKELTAVS